jgi:peptide/nickel transport system substrate-binding protein
MKFGKPTVHPLLVVLAVAMVTALFAMACGTSATATPGPNISATLAAETAVAEAAAAEQAAADEAAAALQAKYGGSITMAFFGDHSTLDPSWSVDALSNAMIENVYEPLLRIDEKDPNWYVPVLAESWEINDDLTSYTFHLRQGVTFRHGKEFKAEDVLFSINRIRDPEADNPNFSLFASVTDIVAIDDYTVRFDLNASNGFFLDAFTIYPTHILPADVDVDRLILEEFGTGPFILDEFLPGERAIMVRNPDYWEEGLPYLDEIVFVGIAEAVTRAESLKSGDIDVVYLLEPQSVADIQAHPETKVLSVASAGHYGITMDNSSPPFDNKLVRKAFQAATDRDMINLAATLGMSTITYDHPFAQGDRLFASQHTVEYDPELAKSLLEEAGYPDGIDIIGHTGDVFPGAIDMMVAFKESAAPAGIRVEIKVHPSDAFWSEVFMQFPFVVISWSPRASMDLMLTQAFHGASPYNAMRYFNDEFDALIERARGETQEQQIETYAEIQRILVDDVPMLVIGSSSLIYGARNNVEDVGPTPVRYRSLKYSWLSK